MPAEQRLVEGHKAWQMDLQEKNSEWLQAVEEAKKKKHIFGSINAYTKGTIFQSLVYKNNETGNFLL